jgi:hypothetical protein
MVARRGVTGAPQGQTDRAIQQTGVFQPARLPRLFVPEIVMTDPVPWRIVDAYLNNGATVAAMSTTTVDDIPIKDDLIDSVVGRSTARWFRWLSAFRTRVTASTQLVASVNRTAIAANIAATTVYTPTQPATFRISWAVQVKTAAGVASSITVTITWNSETAAVAQSETFAPAIAGNTTATHGSGTFLIRPNSGDPIRYSTAYVSNPAAAMRHDIQITVEQVT